MRESQLPMSVASTGELYEESPAIFTVNDFRRSISLAFTGEKR